MASELIVEVMMDCGNTEGMWLAGMIKKVFLKEDMKDVSRFKYSRQKNPGRRTPIVFGGQRGDLSALAGHLVMRCLPGFLSVRIDADNALV